MKFGKEYEAQMVPEWQEAYMGYSFLKTLLKEIQKFQKKTKAPHHNHHNHQNHHHHHQETAASALKRKLTLYRTFSGLTKGKDEYQAVSPNQDDDLENQAIRFGPVVSGDGSSGCYRTTFLMPSLEGGEYELVYFRRLDDEFNKVNKFYKEKVVEVMKEADLLSQQMNALIAFRVKIENPIGWRQPERSVGMTRLASDIAASAAALAASTPSGAKSTNRRGHGLDAIDEGSTRYGRPDESMEEKAEEEEEEEEEEEQASNETDLGGNQNAGKESEEKPLRSKNVGPAPLQILKHVKINNAPETPRSTLKTILKVPNQTNLKFTRENLRKVEAQLKRAFVAFYQKLRLLKSFSFLNTLAFSKIMKKYDKITSRNASKPYMAMIDSSCLGSSDEVTKLIERVEATFIKHFSNSNRTKGMSILRPKAKKERHRTTFSTGFFAGTTIALLIGLILIFRARKLMHEPGRMVYMETMFPLYSLFGFIVLHLLMYAVNIYFWRRYRVNYSFIFGFKPGTEPSYRQVSLLGFGIATLALCCVLLNLDMEMDPETKDYKALTELLPLNLLLVLLILLFSPFNILYRPGRFFFLTCLFRCIASPLYKVTLPDFFLADQLTSQVQALRSLEFYICYYVWGDYKKRLNTCPDNSVYITFSFIVAVVPYWSRLLQCLRRLFEEKDPNQAQNGLKYFLTIVAVSMRTAYKHNKESEVLRAMAWTSSAIAAIVSTHWDLVHDWGLLQRGSKNAWLRDKLLIPCNNVYYVAMVLNVLLRFAWLQTVLNFNLGSLHNQTIVAIVASLEIFRRGMWNFFRLENEHLNNVGKYRAFKSVPLPFNYDEDDDKDE